MLTSQKLLLIGYFFTLYSKLLAQTNSEEQFNKVKFLTEGFSKEWIIGHKVNVMGSAGCRGTYTTYTFSNSSDLYIKGCNRGKPVQERKEFWKLDYNQEDNDWTLAVGVKSYRMITTEPIHGKNKQTLTLLQIRRSPNEVIEKIQLYHIKD